MDSGIVPAGTRSRFPTYGPDVALALVLAIVACVLRGGGSPTDGLWYDDAWVGIGAVKGSISDIPMTGGAHAGYTILLWVQHRVVGGEVERLAWSAFVFGVLGPAVVYGCLRSLRYGRAGSLFAAAALVVTPSHVTYSGRVKSYTIDVVLVMVMVAVLPSVSQRRWTWAGAAGWVVAAVAVGSISGYVMLASAVAIGILVLHSRGDDRRRRASAMAAQGLIQGGWVLYARRFADLDEIEAFMESSYDAHVERSANPIELGHNLLRHLERVVDVHPGAPSAFLGVLALAVLGGLVLGARSDGERPHRIVSHFAVAALGLAAIGGLLDRFPFGPSTHDVSTLMGAPGARHSLWLVPVTSIAVCNLIDRAERSVRARPRVGNALRGVVVLGAVLLVASRWDRADPYVSNGGRHLAALVDDAADRGAFIVLDEHTSHQYFVLTDQPMRLTPTPEEMVGFVPEPRPDAGVVLGPVLLAGEVTRIAATGDHDRLVVYGIDIPYDDDLLAAGWRRGETAERGGLRVTVWHADPPT